MRSNRKIVVTPINLKNPSSILGQQNKANYLRENKESDNFTTFCTWHDNTRFRPQVGELFGFVHQAGDTDFMEVFEIVDLPITPLRILTLSPQPALNRKWSDFKQQNGYSDNFKIRSSTRLRFKE